MIMQLGIAIVNDFKSIEGDRTLGLQVILLFFCKYLSLMYLSITVSIFLTKKKRLKFCSHFLLLLGWKLQNGYVLEQLISLNYLLQARHLLLFLLS